MFQRWERVRSARLEASPDIAEHVANAIRFDQAVALRGVDKGRTHFRFADQALTENGQNVCVMPRAARLRPPGARLASVPSTHFRRPRAIAS
jgi:hypothetical protein